MAEALSKDQHEVAQNEDDMQHINVSAPGSGNGKFVMFFFLINFTYLFVSNTVYIILSLVFVTVMLYLQ